MKVTAIALMACAVLPNHSYCSRATQERGSAHQSPSQNTIHDSSKIGKEAAIAVATRDSREKLGSRDKYAVAPCEAASVWLVFFEPVDLGVTPNAVLYHVEKDQGWIVSQREFLGSVPAGGKVGASSNIRHFRKEEAVAEAKKDAVTAYGSLNLIR